MDKLTVDEIRRLLAYNPETGELRWKVRRSSKRAAGTLAGSQRPDGYGGIVVEILHRPYMAHDLAWACHFGRYPRGRLGHRDLNRLNNRIANLFETATFASKSGGGLSQDRLRSLMNYDPDTGLFTWRLSRGGKRGPCTCENGSGYIVIRVDGVLYRAHRLAWLYTHGRWPSEFIDHINGVRNDNRIVNLREATKTGNNGNSKLNRNNKSGRRGVHFSARIKMWVAQIHVSDHPVHLGNFKSKDDAFRAYMNAARVYFGEFCPTPLQAQAKTEES